MVTRTFRQPGANEPVDAQRLTLSPAPFVILTREVRWHAGLPYGYPHLSSTRGQTSSLTRRDWHRLLHLFSSRDSESGGRRRYLMVIRGFRQPRGTNSTVSGWCWSFDADHFQKFCKFLLSSSENIQAQRRVRFFSAGKRQSGAMAKGSVVVVQLCRFQDTEVCWRFWCLFFSFWMTGSIGRDIDRPNDVPLEQN